MIFKAKKKSQELLDFTILENCSHDFKFSKEYKRLINKYNIKYSHEITNRYKNLLKKWDKEK